MHEAGHPAPKLVLWGNPEGWGGRDRMEVGGGFRTEGTHVYTYGQFILMYGKNCNNIVVILQLK